MELKTAAQRYEERRQFWAREIALMLERPSHQSRVLLLRYLAVSPQAIDSKAATAAIPLPPNTKKLSHIANIALVLKFLSEEGLVTRIKRDKSYWYTITELGALVLTYLPIDRERAALQSAPSSNGAALEEHAYD